MKSFFSRLNDIQAGSSKPTKESSYKFWIPSNTNAERSSLKPIPVHSDVAAPHGEKQHRVLKHTPKIPLHDVPTAPIETQTIRTNDMSKHMTRPNLGSSSTSNYLPPSSRTPRLYEHTDTKYQVPPREAHGSSSKGHRGGRHESVAPVPREIWLPSTTQAISKQVNDQTKLHVQGTERYWESGDDKTRVKELERREKNTDRDRREREKEREREREWEKSRTREREREERDRERSRAKGRERGHEKEREIARGNREQNRNWELDRGKDRENYAERDRRERERDSDREGENRTKDKGSRKETSNLTRGMERAWDSNMLYDGERTKKDERTKVRHRDKITGGGGKDDNRQPHKERDRWLEKEPDRSGERLGGQIKHRAEATDGEQNARRAALDCERQKDSGIGWASDTQTGHSRNFLRKTSNTPGAEDGDSSDSSTRPKRMQQVLTKRHRAEEGGSSFKIVYSRAEPLTSIRSSVLKATIVTVSEDVQLPVPPTPQHMPIYLPPKESNVVDSSLPPTIGPLNVVSAREAETPPRRETVSRLKSNRPDEPLLHTENVSKPREIDTLSIIRRPPSRGPAQSQNLVPSHPTIAPSLKGTRESVYVHKPRHTQPSLPTVHDKLQIPGPSPLPEIPHTSTQTEGSKEPNPSPEHLSHVRLNKEVDMDSVQPVLYKLQHRILPQSAGAVPSRQPMESTPPNDIPLASSDPALPLSNPDPELTRKAPHPLPLQGNKSAAERSPLHNLQLHNWDSGVISSNNLVRETHSRGTPSAQVVLGKPEPMDPRSNTAMQSLQPEALNENVIQSPGKQTFATIMVSKMNEVGVTPQNEVSPAPIKLAGRSVHQLYTGLSIHRPSTAMDYRSLGRGWRTDINVISPSNLSNQEKSRAATTSSVDLHPRISPLKSSQSRSNRQESLGIAITRPSTTTGFRQNTFGKNLRHHNMLPDDSKVFHGEGFQVATISLSRSDTQNNVGISIPRPSTATAIKQNGSSHQIFSASSHKMNPPLGEEHSSISPSPSTPKQHSIPATNPQPITLPIAEKGSGFLTQPYSVTPNHTAGPSLSRGHTVVLPQDVTVKQDVPGFYKQGVTDGAADLLVTSHPGNFTSQASITQNTKPENLQNPTTPPAVSISTSNDDLVKLHSPSVSAYKQDSRELTDHVPSVVRNSHQAFKENSVVLQPVTPASVNNSTDSIIALISLNAKASSAQPIIPPSSLTAPQIQIRRPPTSLGTRNNSVPSALPVINVPQIQIHHLITSTSTGNKPDSPHADFLAGASTLHTPGLDLETSDVNRLAIVNANILPIHVDQPQILLGSGNKAHRPVHLVPSTSHTVDANDVRPSINEGTLPSHAEGSSQELSTQTFLNNHSATLSSHQPASDDQIRHDSVQNLNLQMNNDLTQGSPSLGFFSNTFSEILQSSVVRRPGQRDHLVTIADGRKLPDLSVSADFQTNKNDGTTQTINVKMSESLVNTDGVKNALLKEQLEVPSVERLITRKDLHIGIHSSNVAFSQIPSEVNPSPKSPSSPSQSRVQHPGLAEILSSPPFNKDHNNAQPPSSSITHHLPTTSPVLAKSGSSPKFQGSPDKQRPDNKLVSSPSRQLLSDLRQKEVEQHESPKRQLQQTATPTSSFAHLQNLLLDPHRGDSLGPTPSKVPSSSSNPPTMSHPPGKSYATTSSIPDGITRPFLEAMPHIYNKKSGQSGTSYPEVPISNGGLFQVEELASRKIRAPSTVDTKSLGNNTPHYRATTPLRESTIRHQRSASLPLNLVPPANVPSVDGPLHSAPYPPLQHHSTNHSQTKPSSTRPPGLQALTPNITRSASDSEETILMTPSSLAHSVMLKSTISRQSVTASVSSQTTRKGASIFTIFRSKTPAQPPPQYEIWHPNTSSAPNVASSTTVASSFTLPEQKTPAPVPVPVTSVPVATEHIGEKSKVFTPFRYLTTKRNRAVSLLSVEAQDGTAPSTVVGSPTASVLSQAPFQPPPVRDPMQATKEWRNKDGTKTHPNGKLRRQRPGVVFDVAEEPPEGDHQRSKRQRKSSSKKNQATNSTGTK